MAKRRSRPTIPGASAPVSADQRSTSESPCPICGGHQGAPRGQGARCFGYLAGNGRGAVCTEVESDREAGDSGGWYHALEGAETRAEADAAEVYVYADEDGEPLFSVVRGSDKRFHQELPDGTRKVAGVRQVPFHLPALIAGVERGEVVYVVEGEKDVLSMERAGYVATTNSGGAGKWREDFARYFEGARVVVVADRDEKGEAHARAVRRNLLPVAQEVVVVAAATGKDATDHLEAGHVAEEFEPIPPRFEQIRLGSYVPKPVEWLAEPILIEQAYTVATSKPGKGKTSTALALSVPLIHEGRKVVLLDQENGPDKIASLLRAMGADSASVDEQFGYFPYPSAVWEEVDELVAEVAALSPDLVIVDAKANFIAAAGLDEDLAVDLTRWHARVVQPLQAIGAAVLDLDHSGHKDDGRPRGSSAKEAVAEASWVLQTDRAFDRKTTATLTLQRGTKNRLGVLPERVLFQIGGDGKGGFIFRLLEGESDRHEEDLKKKHAFIRDKVISALREHGPLSGNQIEQIVRGADRRLIREVYKDLPVTPGSGVVVTKGQRGALVYSLASEEDEG